METLVIMTPSSVTLDELTSPLTGNWRIEKPNPERLVVDAGTSRIYIHEDGTFGDTIKEPGATSEELVRFYERSGDARFFLMDYSDKDLAGKVIEMIANHPTFIVDDDFGTTLPGNEFVALVKGQRWRSS